MNTSYHAYRALRNGLYFDDDYMAIFLLLFPFIALGIALGILALTGQLGSSAEATAATEEVVSILNRLIV